MTKRYAVIVSVLAIAVLLSGCRGKREIAEESGRTPASSLIKSGDATSGVTSQEGRATSSEIAKAIKGEDLPVRKIPAKDFKEPSLISAEAAKIFQTVHFDFDSYEIRSDAREILNGAGKYLLANPKMQVLTEGHCDERGTREYNMVLGEQRALSIRRYLVSLGVSSARLHTSSYGKDKPVDTASTEEAWAKNRRGEFKLAE